MSKEKRVGILSMISSCEAGTFLFSSRWPQSLAEREVSAESFPCFPNKLAGNA